MQLLHVKELQHTARTSLPAEQGLVFHAVDVRVGRQSDVWVVAIASLVLTPYCLRLVGGDEAKSPEYDE
jgi:hypothetical protein